MTAWNPDDADRSVAASISEALLAALADRDRGHREAAIKDASHQADPDELIDLVADHEDARKRNAAIEALARGGARSVPSLIRALRHEDPEVVMFAAATLGRTRDPAAIPHLVRLLAHRDPNVAQAAIDSLARLRATVAVGALVRILDRDPWLRFAAVHALGEIGDAHAVGPLLPLLADESIREVVIQALGKIGSSEAIAPLSLLLRESSDSTGFAACLRAISKILEHQPDPEVLGHISDWAALGSSAAADIHDRLVRVLAAEEPLASDDVELRGAAATIVRALRLRPLYTALVLAGRDPLLSEVLQFCAVSIGPEIAPSLEEGLAGPNPNVRVLACQCVAALGLCDCLPQVVRLVDDADPTVRATAVHTLGRLNHVPSVSAIITLLRDPSKGVREAVVTALSRMDPVAVTMALLRQPLESVEERLAALEVMRANPHRQQIPLIEQCIGDGSPAVRRMAVAAVTSQESYEYSGTLECLLDDANVDVRREVIAALGHTRRERVRGLLLQQVERDPHTRPTAIRALGSMGDARTTAALIRALEGDPEALEPAVIDALGALQEPASEPILVRLLGDERPAVRLAAVQALGAFASQAAVKRVAARLRDPEPAVRRAVAETLYHCRDTTGLEQLAMDPDRSVAVVARRHLEDLGTVK